jgi:hypothetical protein
VAAKEAQATKDKTIKERASRPLQRDIGSINVFWSLAHARVVISDWKHEYNWHRPQCAIPFRRQILSNNTSPPLPNRSVNRLPLNIGQDLLRHTEFR